MATREEIFDSVFNGEPTAEDPVDDTDEGVVDEEPEAEEPENTEPEGNKANDEDDPWAGTAPALRKQLQMLAESQENIINRIKTTEGRVGSIQSELAKKAASETRRGGEAAPTQRQIDGASRDSSKWDELRDDFPEWAEALEEKLGDIDRRFAPKTDVESLQASIQKQIEDRINQERELIIVKSRHPRFEQVVKSPEFNLWLDGKPELTDKRNSPYAADAIDVLDAWEAYRAAPKKSAEDLKRERRQRLERSTAVGGVPQPPTKSVSDMTNEEYRQYIFSKTFKKK
jgi:hypothetical protein